MKIFTTKLLALVTSALLLGACSQMATYENEDLLANQEVAARSGFNLTPYGSGGNENAYQVDSYFTYSSESNTICYDEAGSFTVSFFAQNTAIACGNFMIQYAIFEEGVDLDALDWQNLTETTPSSGVVSATLTGLPIGEYVFRGQWVRTGSTASCSTLYVNTGWRYAADNLIVEECSECDEADFSYETANNQDITFTYNHGEEVESLTLAFTFPQVQDMELNENGKYVAPDGKIYSVNNPTNQTVFTWTGDVSCKTDEASTFAFSMTPDCSAPPANDGKANIWTDAKVVGINGVALVDDLETFDIDEGPYSLKGDLTNIVFEGCPTD